LTEINVDTRYQAFFSHLLLSSLIITALAIIIVVYWYPNGLIYAGGVSGLKILILVDVVLGPLLTLMVFDKSKASLKFDLLVIIFMQLACLAGGIWLIYNERPVAQLISHKGLHLITHSELKLYQIKLESLNEKVRPDAYLLDLPNDWSTIPALEVTTEFVLEKPFSFRHDLYIPLSKVSSEIFNQRIEKISEKATLVNEDVTLPKALKGCNWLPIISQHVKGHACVALKSGIVKLSRE